MPKQLSTALTIVLTFFMTLALNTAVNFYTSDKGAVGVSRSIMVGGKIMSVISIENYSRDFLEGVAVEIPTGIATSDVTADGAVAIVDVPGTQQPRTRLVRINQIPPRLVTRVFVPAPDAAAAQLVRVVNSDAAGLRLRRDDELESPLRQALLSALVIASMYALFAVGTTYYANRTTKSVQAQADLLEKQVKIAKRRLDDVETRMTKQRLLLQARLTDHSRELEFWRNTIRALLNSGPAGGQKAEEVVAQVTESLKTFGATPDRTFDAVRVAAAWLLEAEAKATEVSKHHATVGQAQSGANNEEAG